MPDYIHKRSIGDFEQCQAAMKVIGDSLFKLYRKNMLQSYGNYFYHEQKDMNQLMQDYDVPKLTEGKFPFLFVRIEAKGDLDIASLATSLELELLNKQDSKPKEVK